MLTFRYPILIWLSAIWVVSMGLLPSSHATGVLPDPVIMQKCVELDDDKGRLECYDTVTGRTPTQLTLSDESTLILNQTEFPSPNAPPSPLTERWELEAQTDRGPFVITAYRTNYLLPITYQDRVNTNVNEEQFVKGDLNSVEIKFQLSLKAKIWPDLFTPRGDLWIGYTQLSYWQGYNRALSASFRETVYEPELIYTFRTGFYFAGLNNRLLSLSLNHQSNGRSRPQSRSWNRIILSTLWDHGADKALELKLWWRLPESNTADDNPHITNRIGRGEIWGFFKRDELTYAAMLRFNFDPGTPGGALQLDWSFPFSGAFKGYVQYFYGYGDGLIDYDHISNRLSLGLMLTDWM